MGGFFMNNRIARIRMGELVTQGSPLKCGLPLSSPVSPIPFMLYIEPLLKLSNPKGIFGYADDIAFLRTGKTLLQCADKLQKDLEMIIEWGKQNAITFDPRKSELQHFTQAPKPKDYPSIRHEDWHIIPNQETRWLGVWLDRKLSFLSHVRKWSAKVSAAAAHLRPLNNTQKGSRSDLIRQAIKSCVISTAVFGAEAWWPGDTIISWSKGKCRGLKHRSGPHIALLSKTVNLGLRTILLVYKTTPLHILHREAGVPPVPLLLEEIRLRQALRIQTLDDRHPLKKRAIGNEITRLTRMAKILPTSEDSKIASLDITKYNIESNFTPSRHDIHLFADGSRTSDGKAGGGYVIYQAGQKVTTGSFCINRHVEPIDTEIISIRKGLSACTNSAHTRFATNIIVFTDSRTAAGIVNGKQTLTCRKEIQEIRDIQRQRSRRDKLANVFTGHIYAEWVLSHTGVPGNEEADYLAKAGAQRALVTSQDDASSYAAVKTIAVARKKQHIDTWWGQHAPTRYKQLGIQAWSSSKCPTELRLPRKVLHCLISSRSGHGDFKEYHERFHHINFSACSCGKDKIPVHFFFCRLNRRIARKESGRRRPNESIEWLIGTADGAASFRRIIEGSQ